jgi:hypothetical protein
MSSPGVASPRRRRSMTGPVILIVIGLIFLLGNLHLISWGKLGMWFAHYWPLLLILWGVLKLVEHYQAKQEGVRSPGIGAGGVVLLIFLVIAGLTASQLNRVNWIRSISGTNTFPGPEVPLSSTIRSLTTRQRALPSKS